MSIELNSFNVRGIIMQAAAYDIYSPGNRFSPRNTLQYQPADQQTLSMMMPVHSSEQYIEGTYVPGMQTVNIIPHAGLQSSVVAIQQPRIHQVTVQKNVQVPKTVMVNCESCNRASSVFDYAPFRCKNRKKSQPQSRSTSTKVRL